MKLCQNCGQAVAEEIAKCPSCGSEVGEGRTYIDDYKIVQVLHEGHSSILCRAFKEGEDEPVMIRIFTRESGVNTEIAARLKRELEELKKLPEDFFVRHYEIKRSSDGFWYRVSEWIDAENWGSLLASGRLQDYRQAFDLFCKIASILEGLHQIGNIIPHLILDDIIVFKTPQDTLEVKIDYKLSRFLDPGMDRPRPMLRRLLECHPDISNGRPLDKRSDIWSLGKVFVELLSGDPEVTDFSERLEELPLPPQVSGLIKVMLAEDPSLRPQSMASVAKVLSEVKDKDIETARRDRIEAAPVRVKEVKGVRKKLGLLLILVVTLAVIGALTWYYGGFKGKDSEEILIDFANQYAPSVAFVVAEYWIKTGEDIVYKSSTEGTAFLADEAGYLLTNRHVACPWLNDGNLFMVVSALRGQNRSPRFGYRLLLWFEGEKAFSRIPGSGEITDIEDIYSFASAFRTDGVPRLTIAGVAKTPVKTWYLVKSPLKDDFAVLKVEKVPEGLNPLPLDSGLPVRDMPKLSPVIALGFPLGSRIQEATVNVSVTLGHVRRTFENMFQVDTSLHRGNSGGPIIDTRGKVVGIATGVVMDWPSGLIPIGTPLSDIGLVQPIGRAVAMLQELKRGEEKWNGVLDLSVEDKLKKISDLALQAQWSEARSLAEKELAVSPDPTLVMAAGMMHLCAGDTSSARRRFKQALSMDAENNRARLMLYIIDWMDSQTQSRAYKKDLLDLDWRSSDEFLGYLVRILENGVDEKSTLAGGYTEQEAGWLDLAGGLICSKRGELSEAEALFKEAVMKADAEDWASFLGLAQLQEVQRKRMSLLKGERERADYNAKTEEFLQKARGIHKEKMESHAKIAPLISRLKQASLEPQEKLSLLKEIAKDGYRRGEILVGLIYYSAMGEAWDESLGYIKAFFQIKGRENADRLSVGLLEPAIMSRMGKKDEARTRLKDFLNNAQDPWYRAISEHLLGKRTEKSLMEMAGDNPANILTAHTSLGFWAEDSGEIKKAIGHYREALGSYLDDRIEYAFALERIKKLKVHDKEKD
jgi:S1-C subfamily serine protease